MCPGGQENYEYQSCCHYFLLGVCLNILNTHYQLNQIFMFYVHRIYLERTIEGVNIVYSLCLFSIFSLFVICCFFFLQKFRVLLKGIILDSNYTKLFINAR